MFPGRMQKNLQAMTLPSNESQKFHFKIRYETTTSATANNADTVKKSKPNCRNIDIPVVYPSRFMMNLTEIWDFNDEGTAITGIPRTRKDTSDSDVPATQLGRVVGAGRIGDVDVDVDNGDARAAGAARPGFQSDDDDESDESDHRLSPPLSSFPPSSCPASPSKCNPHPPPTFLTIPLELRLQIYKYLLPSSTHTITTQYPYTGIYYPSTPEYSARGLYEPLYLPLQNHSWSLHSFPSRLTTYTISHSHCDESASHIYPEILRTNRQIYEEAVPVLYGKGQIFEFGTSLDAVGPFMRDRGVVGREVIRELRVCVDVPDAGSRGNLDGTGEWSGEYKAKLAGKWREICEVLRGDEVGVGGMGNGSGVKKCIEVVVRGRCDDVRNGNGNEEGGEVVGANANGGGEGVGVAPEFENRVRGMKMEKWNWVWEVLGLEKLVGGGDVGVEWCGGVLGTGLEGWMRTRIAGR